MYQFHKNDPASAVCWSYVGAMQGSIPAQDAYAESLRSGKGIRKDTFQAFIWFQKTALRGDY
jgi:TPR repeat protein